MLPTSCHTDMADRSLELDQGVSLVVGSGGISFAVGAEVKVIADSALVTNSTNVGRVGIVTGAQGTVTADTNVNRRRASPANVGESFISRHETVAWVSEVAVLVAIRAVVPVRAVQTLVTDTCNVLVAAIAESVMDLVTARAHLDSNVVGHLGSLDSSDETMHGVVTMSVLGKARLAEVKILTSGAVKKFGLR